jgi:hypothetical protein
MSSGPIPQAHGELTPSWLTSALRESGVIRDARVISVAVQPIGVGTGFVGDIARLRLTYDRVELGTPASLIAKLPTSDARRRIMSIGARLFEREIRFYSDIAGDLDLRTPRSYYGATDLAEHRHLLLLEDLAPARAGDQVAGCSVADAELALRSIARLHAAWWQSERLAELEWMPLQAAVHPSVEAWWDEMWRQCLERAGDRIPAAALRVAEGIGGKAMYAVARLGHAPQTVAHGDFRLDNVFFEASAGGDTLALVDWQLSTRGSAALDMGYFLCGSLSSGDRKAHEMRLLRAWHDELLARGVRGYAFDDAVRDYRLSIVVCLAFVTFMLNVIESADERATRLFDVLLDRTCAAAAELDLEELLPG